MKPDRLISANALEAKLKETDIALAIDKGKMFKLIDEAPTVDSVPVYTIKLLRLTIDRSGVPELTMKLGEKTLVLRTDPVDVKEVVHGRWIDRPVIKGQVYCSECGTIEKVTDSNYKSRLCPNCGAKMDGGTPGDTGKSDRTT